MKKRSGFPMERLRLRARCRCLKPAARFRPQSFLPGAARRTVMKRSSGSDHSRLLADHLTRNGFAVLRCDDRGVGGSTGDMKTSTTAGFLPGCAGDARFLQARREIKGSQIGMIGHSEGAEVAAMSCCGIEGCCVCCPPRRTGDSR